jgi:MFS family permease
VVTDLAAIARLDGRVAPATMPFLRGAKPVTTKYRLRRHHRRHGLVTSVYQLFVARLLQGVFAGFSVMAMAVASVSCPRDKEPVAIGRVQSAQLLSVAVGPVAGGYVASHFGIRYAFFVTAGLCARALVGLILLFKEERPGGAGEASRQPPRLPLRQIFLLPHFPLVLGLRLICQFIDRGLALLIPLKVADIPGVGQIAAISGVIISVSAVCGTISAGVAGRLAQRWPVARLLVLACVTGGVPCALMAWADRWVLLLTLRCLVGLSLGGAVTLAYLLGGHLAPSETRGAAFGWLALGQFGTALSPLATGGLAALSLSGAFVFDGALAWVAAALLLFAARDLINRRH